MFQQQHVKTRLGELCAVPPIKSLMSFHFRQIFPLLIQHCNKNPLRQKPKQNKLLTKWDDMQLPVHSLFLSKTLNNEASKVSRNQLNFNLEPAALSHHGTLSLQSSSWAPSASKEPPLSVVAMATVPLQLKPPCLRRNPLEQKTTHPADLLSTWSTALTESQLITLEQLLRTK